MSVIYNGWFTKLPFDFPKKQRTGKHKNNGPKFDLKTRDETTPNK